MFFFLFLYMIAYLSGVSACTELVKMGQAGTVVGCILLPFYAIVPLWRLWICGIAAKDLIHEAALRNKRSYEQCIPDFTEEAIEEKFKEIDYALSRQSVGYKAAIINMLVAPYEEKFWWWKIFILGEKAALAIIIITEMSAWWAVGVASIGFLSSVFCRPFWEAFED